MERQAIDLGLILKHFDIDFSMDTFDDRLKLQKFIYLLQAFDIYLGYDFSWYLRGPYCSSLATSGFALTNVYETFPSRKTKFVDPEVQHRFEKFQEFIKNRKTDNIFLEIAASLHRLNATDKSEDKDPVRMLMDKKPGLFSEKQCREIWEYLKKWSIGNAKRYYLCNF